MNQPENHSAITGQKKKILCIVQLPPPVHGASIMNDNLINGDIVNKHFNLIVVNLQFLKSIDNISRFSVSKFFKAFGIGFEIIWKILTQKPDLVYLTFATKGFALFRDLGYAFLVKILGKRIVFHLHEKGIKSGSKKSRFKKLLYWKAFKNESVICISEKVVPEIEDVYKEAPYIVPNGIRFYKHSGGKEKAGTESIPRILFLSNYMLNKGILTLIDAIEILKNKGYNLNARLVGGPIDFTKENLQKIIDGKKLSDCVHITGPLYNDDKISELENADIFVLPSKSEAFPLVILEAMQFSLPVVSTFEGGIPEMVADNETGFLVEPDNTEELAEKIGILLDNKDLRTTMGKKGFERYKGNYTVEIFENNMIKTFDKILK